MSLTEASRTPPVPTRTTVTDPAPDQLPWVVLARDVPRDELDRAVRRGQLVRVRRGAYRDSSGVDPDEDAFVHVAAVHRALTTTHAFSHDTAAMLHGIRLWRRPSATHLTQPGRPPRAADGRLVRHHALVRPEDVVHVRGVPATSLARTVVDCLTTLPAPDGLVVADAAMRLALDPADVDARLRDRPGRRGVTRALAVLAHADPGAESPWESVTRWVALAAGLPPPQTQMAVVTRLGTYWCDLGWPEWHVALEFDGRVKYGGPDARDALFREKRRADAIEEAGTRLLRVTAADLRRPDDLLSRLCLLLPASATSSLRPRRALGVLRAGTLFEVEPPGRGRGL